MFGIFPQQSFPTGFMQSVVDELRSFFEKYERATKPDAPLVRAGVLVPIFEKGGEPHFLLTKRTQDVEHHKGQISFPGGAVDTGDRDIVATALRESDEEIGLPADHVEVLGLFDDLIIPTGFVVTPVVGYVAHMPALRLNNSEVNSVLEVPLSFFRDPKNRQVLKMMRGGVVRDVYLFPFEHNEIWGATAFIINSFLEKLGANS
jgi:8-oxo-dGTP pyrophosphatase MutT (NUDIX family)